MLVKQLLEQAMNPDTLFDVLWKEYLAAEDTPIKHAGDEIRKINAGESDDDIDDIALDAQVKSIDELGPMVDDPNDSPDWVSAQTRKELLKISADQRQEILDKFGDSVYEGLT
jgi:hypothetical protein